MSWHKGCEVDGNLPFDRLDWKAAKSAFSRFSLARISMNWSWPL
ncbi:hypothetical protein IWQ54_000094 [Labrenzia sp. EL_195]|nr:hypothetical protein [Labrenzia sp. EL_195]